MITKIKTKIETRTKLQKLNQMLTYHKVEKYEGGFILLEEDRLIIHRKTLQSIINELYNSGIISSKDI